MKKTGLHKLWYPGIRDTSTWSKFGAHGEHGDVFLFSNLGALWFSENRALVLGEFDIWIKIFIVCLFKGSQKQSFFLQTLLFRAFLVTNVTKNVNIRTCEHVILGQLRIGARQTKNAALYDDVTILISSYDPHFHFMMFWPLHPNNLKHIIWGIGAHQCDDDHIIRSTTSPFMTFFTLTPIIDSKRMTLNSICIFSAKKYFTWSKVIKKWSYILACFFCSQILFLPLIKLRTEARYKGKRSGTTKSYFPKDLRI